MTMDELAHRTGYSRVFLHNLKSGKKRYNADNLKIIAEALGCTPAQLISEIPKENSFEGMSAPPMHFWRGPGEDPRLKQQVIDIADAVQRAWAIAQQDFAEGFEIGMVNEAVAKAVVHAQEKKSAVSDHLLRHYLHELKK